jgi:broad specificity phosphatase PhoE
MPAGERRGQARAWLIRHGESESNAGLPTNGPAISPLTATGRAQAERVARLFTEPPALIVASSFVRARQTAEPTRRRFPDVPYEEWPVQEFTYLGSLHGPATTTAQRRPHALAYWERCDPCQVNGGDGESFADLLDRVDEVLGRLTVRSEGLAAVFTHGLFMRALTWSVLTGRGRPAAPAGAVARKPVTAEEMRDYQRFCGAYRTPNGCVVELRHDHDGPWIVGGAVTHLPPDLITGD